MLQYFVTHLKTQSLYVNIWDTVHSLQFRFCFDFCSLCGLCMSTMLNTTEVFQPLASPDSRESSARKQKCCAGLKTHPNQSALPLILLSSGCHCCVDYMSGRLEAKAHLILFFFRVCNVAYLCYRVSMLTLIYGSIDSNNNAVISPNCVYGRLYIFTIKVYTFH